MEKLGKMLKQQVYSTYELLKLAWEKIDSIIDWVTSIDTNKTNLFGDHKGTWNGFKPSQVDVAINSIIEAQGTQINEIVKFVDNSMTQAQIQNVLDNYSNVRFKKGIYNIAIDSITGVGLNCRSGSIVTFERGAKLQAIGTSNEVYMIFNIDSVEDVIVNNITTLGERNTHIGTTGEWGFGILINNSKNVTLNNPKAHDCWGDGIVIGGFNGTNENIKINNPYCNNNRRQGISFITGKDVTITNPYCTNTNGTSPEAGIDIEPDSANNDVENLRIINPRTSGNNNVGILIALGNLSNTDKIVDIKIDNHRDDNSKGGLMLGQSHNLKGVIEVNNPVWINSKNNALISENHVTTSPTVFINKPKIIKPHRLSGANLLNNPKWGSVISIYREAEDIITQPLGNIIIDDLSIENTDVNCFANISTYDTTDGAGTKSIIIRNPLKFGLAGKNLISNTNIMEVRGYNVKSTLAQGVTSNLITNIDNTGATGTQDLYVAEDLPIGTLVNVEISVAQKLRIYTFSHTILNYKVAGKVLSSSNIGSKITIEKIDSSNWVVRNILGTWAEEIA